MATKKSPADMALSVTASPTLRSGLRVSRARVAELSKPTKLNTAKVSEVMIPP